MGILLQSVALLVLKRVQKKQNFIVSQLQLDSLEVQERTAVMGALTQYQVFGRNRTMEIGHDYAMKTNAAQTFAAMSGTAKTMTIELKAENVSTI
jgi:hypothetical protein